MAYMRSNSEYLSDQDTLEISGTTCTIREWCIRVEQLEDKGKTAEAEIICHELEENGWPM